MSSTVGRRRYSLIAKNMMNGKEYLIKIKERDDETGKTIFRDKSFLTTIDKRTTDFEDESDLLNYLYDNDYIDFTYGEVYITYKENKTIKTLDVIYKEQQILKKLASRYTTYIDINDPEFKKILNNFLENIKKGRFYRYMTDNKYLNSRLKSLLELYLYENMLFKENELMTEFSRYKVIRGYILAKSEFYGVEYDDIFKQVSNNPQNNDGLTEPKPLNLDTDDDFLNTLTDRDDIMAYYDLDQLSNKDIDGPPLFDGLAEVTDKVKRMER